MKKNIFWTILFFILITFILSVIFSMAILLSHNELTLTSLLDQSSSTFLYLSGYESGDGINIYFKVILAILGTVILSIISAYLTVYFLTRTNVFLDKKIYIFKKENGHFYCSLELINKGNTVCNIELFFCLINSKSQETPNRYKIELFKPIILKESKWILNFDINPMNYPLFFEALSRFYTQKDNDFNIYAIYSFIDDKTNTGSTHISIYSKDDIEFKDNSANNTKTEFLEFIKHPFFKLDLKRFQPINSSFLAFPSEKDNLIRNNQLILELKFNTMEEVLQNKDNFTMACLDFVKAKNWQYFYENNWILCLSINSTVKSSQLLKLEFKSRRLGNSPFFEKFIPLEKGTHTYYIDLNEKKDLEEDFKELSQFDLTIPFYQLNELTKNAKISINKIEIIRSK